MTQLSTETHVEAAQRQLRLHAWGEQRVNAAWHELTLRRVRDEAKRRRAKRIAGPLLLAAALALAIVGWRGLAPSSAPGSSPVATQEAGVEHVLLGDGTDVRLDQGAQLEVREREADRVVVAVKTGLARFRVRHDPERVFRVHAGDVEVEDIGTTFDVENKARSVRVSVTEGSVMVSFSRAEEGDARGKVLLKAGESGVYPAIARGLSLLTAAPRRALRHRRRAEMRRTNLVGRRPVGASWRAAASTGAPMRSSPPATSATCATNRGICCWLRTLHVFLTTRRKQPACCVDCWQATGAIHGHPRPRSRSDGCS
jgi:ferric-dicitrate binding protein FerR (iron transport regulator)